MPTVARHVKVAQGKSNTITESVKGCFLQQVERRWYCLPMTYEQLTFRQEEALEFIRSYIEKNGIPPTNKEIGKAIDSNESNASRMVSKLAIAGFLKRRPGARGIILIPQPTE